MAAINKPTGIRFKALADDVIARVTGHRIFTDIMTDAAVRAKVKAARKRSHGGLTPSNATLTSAALAYKNVKRSH